MGRPKGSLGKNTKKKVKDANKPKRATSAYFFFLAQCRKEAAKAGKPPTKIAEFTKDASEKWKALPADKKKPFEAAAAQHLIIFLLQAGEEWRSLSNEDKKPYEKKAPMGSYE